MNRLVKGAMLLTLCVGTFAGCATVDKKAIVQNKSVDNAASGRGVVFLTMDGNEWNDPHRRKPLPLSSFNTMSRKKLIIPQKITLVKVKTDKGVTAGNFVMPVYSGDLIISGLKKALIAAGYTVILVRKLPAKAKIGRGVVG